MNPALLFQFRLAKDLGKFVEDIRQMSVWQFIMWQEFYRREYQAIEERKNK